ncbi:hypothetical protein D3C86_2123400 [compost metagenome]
MELRLQQDAHGRIASKTECGNAEARPLGCAGRCLVVVEDFDEIARWMRRSGNALGEIGQAHPGECANR